MKRPPVYFGMHYVNDPKWELDGKHQPHRITWQTTCPAYNIEIGVDLVATTISDIEEGQKLFWDYTDGSGIMYPWTTALNFSWCITFVLEIFTYFITRIVKENTHVTRFRFSANLNRHCRDLLQRKEIPQSQSVQCSACPDTCYSMEFQSDALLLRY